MTWATERLDALISGKAEASPVVQTMRLGTLDAWDEGWVGKRWEPDADLLNDDGTMFGGTIAALADQILGFAAMTVLPEGSAFRTINLQVQFLRAARAHPLLIEARVTAHTASMIAVEADFYREEDKALVARAGAQQMLVPFATP
ncbi:MAG TPA: PaaI family thioesterase [Rhizomicrobium sp.]